MSTPTRLFSPDYFYHVYNRGNRKENVFFNYYDRQRFLYKFQEYQKVHPADLAAFTLMDNHYHFLIRPKTEESIPKLFSKLADSHAKYINIKYDLVGRLFQDRFRAKIVDRDEYLVHLSRYIHLNPLECFNTLPVTPGVDLRIEKQKFLTNYPWSSLGEYAGLRNGLIKNKALLLGLGYFKNAKDPQKAYLDFVSDYIEKPEKAVAILPENLVKF